MLFLTMHPRNRVFHFNNCLLRLGNANRWKTAFQNPTVFRSHVCMIKQNHVTSERGFDSKTQLPWPNGLFCTRIFGNLNFKFQRRHRLGTINLAYPVSQIWFLKTSAFVTTLLQQKRSRLLRLSQSRAFVGTPEKTRHPEPSPFIPGAFDYNVALKQNWMPNDDVLPFWPLWKSDVKTLHQTMLWEFMEVRSGVTWDRFLPNGLLFEDAHHVFVQKPHAKTCLPRGFQISPCASLTHYQWFNVKNHKHAVPNDPWFQFCYGQALGFFPNSGSTFAFQRVEKQKRQNMNDGLRNPQTGLFWCEQNVKVRNHVLNHLWLKPENYALGAYHTYGLRWRRFLNPAVWPQSMLLSHKVWFLVNLQNNVLHQLQRVLLHPDVAYPEIAFAIDNHIPWACVLILKLPNKTRSKFKPLQKRIHRHAWKRFWPRENVFLKLALGFRKYALPQTVSEEQNVALTKASRRGSKTQMNGVLSLFHNACWHEQKKKSALTMLGEPKVGQTWAKTKRPPFGPPEGKTSSRGLKTWVLNPCLDPRLGTMPMRLKQSCLFGGKTCKPWLATVFRHVGFLALLASTVVSEKHILFASSRDQNRLEWLHNAFKLQGSHFLGLNMRAVWSNPRRKPMAWSTCVGSKARGFGGYGLNVWAAKTCSWQLWRFGNPTDTHVLEFGLSLRQRVVGVKRVDLGPCACVKQAELRNQQARLYGRFLAQKGPALFRHRFGCVRNGWVHATLRRYKAFMTYACPFDWGFDRTGLVADPNYAMVHYVDRGLTQVQNPTGAAALRWTLSRWEQTKRKPPELSNQSHKTLTFATQNKHAYDGFDFVLSKKQAGLKAEIQSLNAWHGAHGKTLGSIPIHKRRKKCARLNRFFKILKRTRFRTCAQWMTLRFLPVLPPDLRPALMLPNRVLANSDLNLLYQNVLKNNQTCLKSSSFYAYVNPFWHNFPRFGTDAGPKNLSFDWRARQPWVWVHYRRLQASVDALLELGLPGPNTNVSLSIKPGVKSLGMGLKGKRGRFRQNLLGKRVDYSARSVIVVGPNLGLQECGLPEDIAFELFACHLSRKLLNHGFANSLNHAKSQIQMRSPWVYDLLQNVLRDVPVLLNRAPTLHRLGFQAFHGRLIRGRAILLHPLVCGGFNADFDGDQMAVHVPLSPLAQAEASRLMQSSLNMLSPRDGSPNLVPSQDMVLGLTYLTSFDLRYDAERWKVKTFSNATEGVLGQKKRTKTMFTPPGSGFQAHFEPDHLPFQRRCVWQKNYFQTHGKQRSYELQIQPHGGLVWIYPNFKKCVSRASSRGEKEKTWFWVFTSVGRVLMHLHLQKQSLKP